MFRVERRVIEWIEKNKNYIFFGIVFLGGAWVRYLGRNFISKDMSDYLVNWYEEIFEGGGLSAMGRQVGNYNILYQTLIALMTYFGGNRIHVYKMISILFDFLLAFSAAVFVCEMSSEKKFSFRFNLVYAAMLFLPTNILNSAFWGQCDSIYSFFVILTLLYLFKEKYVRAFVFLGLAFAFKLQAIFILPFVACYYLCKKKFSILHFGITAVVFWLSGIVGYLYGRNPLAPFTIYAAQTGEYKRMYMNMPSFWMLLGDNYSSLSGFAVIFTLSLCGAGLYVLLQGVKRMDSAEQFLNTAVWFVWSCVFFLPAMHERYTYLLDIMLILLSFLNKKYIRYAAVSVTLSFLAYGIYLFNNGQLIVFYPLIYLAAWLHFTCFIIGRDRRVNN